MDPSSWGAPLAITRRASGNDAVLDVQIQGASPLSCLKREENKRWIFPRSVGFRLALMFQRRMAMLVPLYRACVKYSVQTYRGGDRFMRAVRRFAAELESYPVSVDGLAPVYINLAEPTWQEHELFVDPKPHEPQLQSIFRALILPTDHVADIGSNLGRHTVLLDKLAAYVHAFEPNPKLLPNLRRTVAGLQHTRLHECALGEHQGTVALDLPADHSMAKVGIGQGDCPMKRLDDLVESRLSLMKVDVEGFEASVFRGGLHLLNHRDAPIVVFEEIKRNRTAHDVLASFGEAQYEFWVIPREAPIEPYSETRPEWCDVLAVPAARLPSVRERLGLSLPDLGIE